MVLAICPCIVADCPDFKFRCPTGESFTIGTCWVWKRFGCYTCRSMESEVRSKCRKFACSGSVSKWYGRNDGCSAGFVSKPFNEVFRFACGIHDICYATPGRSQAQCDDDFKHNMLKTCLFPGAQSVIRLGIGHAVCAAAAGIAYLVVQDHGHNFPGFAATCKEV